MSGFLLRPLTIADAPSIARHADNYSLSKNLRDAFPHPYTLQDAEGFIESVLDMGEDMQCTRAIVVDGAAVGCVSLILGQDVYRKSAEIGYWLGQAYWGQGIVSQAVAQMVEIGFLHYDIVRIFADVFAPNIGSRRVLEKNAFMLEGIKKKSVYKNGEWMDSCIYAVVT